MKKVFLVLCVAAIGFAFTSCKKDCVCSGSYKIEIDGIDPIEYTLPATSVGEMKVSDCESYDWKYDGATPGATVTYDITCKAE
jgi:hypothetical protein